MATYTSLCEATTQALSSSIDYVSEFIDTSVGLRMFGGAMSPFLGGMSMYAGLNSYNPNSVMYGMLGGFLGAVVGVTLITDIPRVVKEAEQKKIEQKSIDDSLT
ncbi:hypothetical protein GOV04_01150 [Candidatus Woesearchaeota archaeon]|nr:hypothetical protein [Candidatus Woesearchaeota archaeon]